MGDDGNPIRGILFGLLFSAILYGIVIILILSF